MRKIVEKILMVRRELCPICMETHDVKLIETTATIVFKDTNVKYPARYYFCERTEEYYSDEELIRVNDCAMKNAYRKAKGLLTSDEIIAIRQKYGITQSDLCLLLGWGEKTITRYESHQVQDFAHDSILRKIADDPAWFLSLLDSSLRRQTINNSSKYREKAEFLFGEKYFQYRAQALSARRFKQKKRII